jgi:hypothetical protein
MPKPTSDPSSRGRGCSNFSNRFLAPFEIAAVLIIAFGARLAIFW